MPHDVPQHCNLLPGRIHHLVYRRLGCAVHGQIDNFGGKLPARLLLDASSNRWTYTTVGGECKSNWLEKKLNVLTCRLIRSKLMKIGTSDTIMHWCPQMHCNVPGNNWLKWRERQTEDDNLEQAHIAVHRQIDHNSRNIQLNWLNRNVAWRGVHFGQRGIVANKIIQEHW